MAKRESFVLEEKPLSEKKPKTKQSNLQSKQCHGHGMFLENYQCMGFF